MILYYIVLHHVIVYCTIFYCIISCCICVRGSQSPLKESTPSPSATMIDRRRTYWEGCLVLGLKHDCVAHAGPYHWIPCMILHVPEYVKPRRDSTCNLRPCAFRASRVPSFMRAWMPMRSELNACLRQRAAKPSAPETNNNKQHTTPNMTKKIHDTEPRRQQRRQHTRQIRRNNNLRHQHNCSPNVLCLYDPKPMHPKSRPYKHSQAGCKYMSRPHAACDIRLPRCKMQ